MIYIVDTHTLVWYFTKDKRLSIRAKKIIQAVERDEQEIIIPAIVLLEAIDIAEKKRVKFEIQKLFNFLESQPNFIIADLNFELIKEIVKIGKGLDLHDRVILITAKIYKGAILSKDHQIKRFGETLW